MSLEKQRDEIAIYQDLGASFSFIQRPYLYQGIILAIVGGLLSICLLSLGFLFLSKDLQKLESFFNTSLMISYYDIKLALQFLLAVVSFAWLSSLSSIRKWLFLFDKSYSSERLAI